MALRKKYRKLADAVTTTYPAVGFAVQFPTGYVAMGVCHPGM
jgi:hypothetical protein